MALPPSTLGVLLLLVAAAILALPAAGESFVCDACAGTRRADVCLDMLQGDPRAAACGDMPCVARSAAEHAVRNASDTRARAMELLAREGPEGAHAVPLRRCCEAYVNAMLYLSQALGLLEARNFVGAEESMGRVAQQAGLCKEAFGDEHPNPMSPYGQSFWAVLGVAAELVELCEPTQVYVSDSR